MHYRGAAASLLLLPSALSHSYSSRCSLYLPRRSFSPPSSSLPASRVVLFLARSPIDPRCPSAAKTPAAPGTRRRITGRVVIIRHCRVMIRECARPLLYAFFLPLLPLPLKGPTEVVDGLNHRAACPRRRRALPLSTGRGNRRGVKGSPVRDQ